MRSPQDTAKLVCRQRGSQRCVLESVLMNSNGLAHKGRLFYNATATESSKKEEGKPGGIKTDIPGNVYATGPGGVLVPSPEAKLLGKFAWTGR